MANLIKPRKNVTKGVRKNGARFKRTEHWDGRVDMAVMPSPIVICTRVARPETEGH